MKYWVNKRPYGNEGIKLEEKERKWNKKRRKIEKKERKREKKREKKRKKEKKKKKTERKRKSETKNERERLRWMQNQTKVFVHSWLGRCYNLIRRDLYKAEKIAEIYWKTFTMWIAGAYHNILSIRHWHRKKKTLFSKFAWVLWMIHWRFVLTINCCVFILNRKEFIFFHNKFYVVFPSITTTSILEYL